jgi:hypothetical protein
MIHTEPSAGAYTATLPVESIGKPAREDTKWKGLAGAGVGVGVSGRGVFVGMTGAVVLVGVRGGTVGLDVKDAVTTSLVGVNSLTDCVGVDIASHAGKVSDANRRMMTIKYLAIFALL